MVCLVEISWLHRYVLHGGGKVDPLLTRNGLALRIHNIAYVVFVMVKLAGVIVLTNTRDILNLKLNWHRLKRNM